MCKGRDATVHCDMNAQRHALKLPESEVMEDYEACRLENGLGAVDNLRARKSQTIKV